MLVSTTIRKSAEPGRTAPSQPCRANIGAACGFLTASEQVPLAQRAAKCQRQRPEIDIARSECRILAIIAFASRPI